MVDDSPDSVHAMCDCEVPQLKNRIYSACTWAIDMLNGVSDSHDLCVYNMAILIAVQEIHLRESSGLDLQEMSVVMQKAGEIAEMMYAHSTKINDPHEAENRRRTLC